MSTAHLKLIPKNERSTERYGHKMTTITFISYTIYTPDEVGVYNILCKNVQ